MPDLRPQLLAWYDREGRDLPWRQSTDPYAVWVSEVMLQQTRVETVIPYYERFLSSFPSAQALAQADEDEVLSHWSGLGYYRRARLLHQGVREVVAQYGGEVPDDAESRQALPGVGRYTAGAIGSIAFGKEEPVVDGNVSRVLARVFRIETPLGASATTKRLWTEAGRMVVGPRPGDFNQALMELGATICTPKSPSCGRCPISDHCEAHASGEQTRLPVKAPRKVPERVSLCAVVATSGRGAARKVWLHKGSAPLFGGLWGVPMSEASPTAALREAGLSARIQSMPVSNVEHVLSHRHLEVSVHRATAAKAISVAGRSFGPDDLRSVGVSALTQKVLRAAGWMESRGDLARPRGTR